jgi:hypothetical protein
LLDERPDRRRPSRFRRNDGRRCRRSVTIVANGTVRALADVGAIGLAGVGVVRAAAVQPLFHAGVFSGQGGSTAGYTARWSTSSTGARRRSSWRWGMTLVIATGGIDLSVGAVMALAGATSACLIARPEDSPLSAIDVRSSLPLIVGAGLLVALLAGLWNGALVAFVRLQPIVATLILMVAGSGRGPTADERADPDVRPPRLFIHRWRRRPHAAGAVRHCAGGVRRHAGVRARQRIRPVCRSGREQPGRQPQ